MAFTPETGSGVAGANSYNTVQQFKDHHMDRGQLTLATEFPDADVEKALIVATDYVEKRFGRRFRGWKRSAAQGLSWPRIDAYDNNDYLFDDVPAQLKRAVNEYALIYLRLERSLAPIPALEFGTIDIETKAVSVAAGGRVTSESKGVGPISKSVTVESTGASKLSATVKALPEYPQADLWIEELLTSGTSRTLVRG